MRSSLPVRLLPSLSDVAFLMPIAFLFGRLDGARTLLADGDIGWHVRAGEWMLAHGQAPRHDLFSFTKPGEPWYAWEWLSEALFAALHQCGGMSAVVLAGVVLIALTCALLYRVARAASGNALLAIAVTLLAAAGSSLHWLARPHLFTLLLVVVFCGLLERARRGQTRALWWLPPATALWTNLHGGFVAGILLVAAYAAGELASAALEKTTAARRARLACAKRFGYAALGCGLASLINPYTIHLHAHLYRYVIRDGYQFEHIQEFLSLSFRHPVAPYFEVMLAAGAAAGFWHGCRRRFTYALLIAMWGHLALVSARHIPIYVLVAAPIVAGAAQEWLAMSRGARVARWLGRMAAEAGAMERIGRAHAVSAAALLALVALFYAPGAPQKFRAEFDPSRYPVEAVKALREGDRVFTHDDWGDYLIYRLYPAGRVFVDGRSDFYGRRFEEQYLDVWNVRGEWEGHLRRYGVNAMLLPAGAALAGALRESGRWQAVYDDGVAIVFRATGEGERGRDREVTKGESETNLST